MKTRMNTCDTSPTSQEHQGASVSMSSFEANTTILIQILILPYRPSAHAPVRYLYKVDPEERLHVARPQLVRLGCKRRRSPILKDGRRVVNPLIPAKARGSRPPVAIQHRLGRDLAVHHAGPLVLNGRVNLQDRKELVPGQVVASLLNESSANLGGTHEGNPSVVYVLGEALVHDVVLHAADRDAECRVGVSRIVVGHAKHTKLRNNVPFNVQSFRGHRRTGGMLAPSRGRVVCLQCRRVKFVHVGGLNRTAHGQARNNQAGERHQEDEASRNVHAPVRPTSRCKGTSLRGRLIPVRWSFVQSVVEVKVLHCVCCPLCFAAACARRRASGRHTKPVYRC